MSVRKQEVFIMRINHNITAVRTNTQLNRNNDALSNAVEKLSSGLKINKAEDDPTGIAIARRLHNQLARLERAGNNAGDGVSALQTAEGAMNEIQSVLQRMRELCVQAANDTNDPTDRETIQNEISQLSSEITRMSQTTEFNGRVLLNGDCERTSYVKNNTDKLAANISVMSITVGVQPGEYDVTVTADPAKAAGTITVTPGIDQTITINGEEAKIAADDSSEDIAAKIQDLCERSDVTSVPQAGNSYQLTAQYYGSDKKIEVEIGETNVLNVAGTDAEVTLGAGFGNDSVVVTKGGMIYVTGDDNFDMRLSVEEGAAAEGKVTTTVLDAGNLELQVGSDEGQTMQVVISRMDSETLEVDKINVRTQRGASEALNTLDDAIARVSQERAEMGAYQNRLERTQTNLDTRTENMDSAISRIEDTDMSSTMTDYTQMNVLTQASTSILAKANQRPETVLQLLQNM